MTTVLFLTLVALSPAADGNDAAVKAAIVRSASARLGAGAEVSVQDLQVNATPAAGPITAVPEPAARVGRPSVFSLTAQTASGPRRIGSAVAVIEASAPHVRARRAIRRGEALTAADVEETNGQIGDVPFKLLPSLGAVTGARATRDLEAGTILTSPIVAAAPLVKSGQQVSVRARIGNIEARTIAIAQQNGQAGDLVRLVTPDSKRTLVGRVLASGEVEVVHGS
jgi:flagellar basal body P-ring formation protein FlgA